MTTKTNKPAKKVGFARLSKAKRAEISSLGGKAVAKLRRKAKLKPWASLITSKKRRSYENCRGYRQSR